MPAHPRRVLAELSYDSAVRALDLQEPAVEQLRARTGTLLAASSLTASFLGAQTIQHAGGLGVLVVLALISLVSSIVLCVYVLLPKRGFVFAMRAPTMYETLYEIGGDEEQVRRRLIYWLDEYWKANQTGIDSLDGYYFRAAVALTLQLVFWSWALAANISWRCQTPSPPPRRLSPPPRRARRRRRLLRRSWRFTRRTAFAAFSVFSPDNGLTSEASFASPPRLVSPGAVRLYKFHLPS
jgi:hypothetical protein